MDNSAKWSHSDHELPQAEEVPNKMVPSDKASNKQYTHNTKETLSDFPNTTTSDGDVSDRRKNYIEKVQQIELGLLQSRDFDVVPSSNVALSKNKEKSFDLFEYEINSALNERISSTNDNSIGYSFKMLSSPAILLNGNSINLKSNNISEDSLTTEKNSNKWEQNSKSLRLGKFEGAGLGSVHLATGVGVAPRGGGDCGHPSLRHESCGLHQAPK